MTPLAIEIMIECYRCAEPGANIPERRWSSLAARAVRGELIARGLIDPDTLRTTERGETYIATLLDVPIPVVRLPITEVTNDFA